jgi:diguanylate cyclase (GGDEF)-like protein
VTFRVPRALVTFLVPGVVLAAAASLVHSGWLTPWWPGVSSLLACLVYGAAILLGWRFRRAKVVLTVVVVGLADGALIFASGHASGGEAGRVLFGVLSAAIPLNLMVFSLLPDRGLLSPTGLRKLLFILSQAGLAVILCSAPDTLAARLFTLPFSRAGLFDATGVPQLGVAAFAVAAVALVIGAILRGGAVEAGLFWVLVASFLAFDPGKSGPLSSFYFAIAAAILAGSVVETSHAMAYRDELTGLPGRRALNEALAGLSGRYCLAMVDVDRFKVFNDRHGHDAGDQVLRMVAAKLSEVRGGGRAYRYGGEEFALVFAGAGLEEARFHLEEARKSIAKSCFTVRAPGRARSGPKRRGAVSEKGKRLCVTVSVGAAEATASRSHPKDVLNAADRALYKAKRGGRNRLST